LCLSVNNEALKEKLVDLVEEPLAKENAELADISVSRYKNNVTLKLFVYSSNPVTIDECARLSRMVGELIDQTGWLEDGYTLEVSSPGLSRPLTTAKDFRFRVGETVRIFFADKARKETTAEIVAADNESVEFRNSDGTFNVPLAEIDRAKIIF